jgi:hypothetical protein
MHMQLIKFWSAILIAALIAGLSLFFLLVDFEDLSIGHPIQVIAEGVQNG